MGRCLTFYGTFTQNEDVMTSISNKCLKYNQNITTKGLYVWMVWLDLRHKQPIPIGGDPNTPNVIFHVFSVSSNVIFHVFSVSIILTLSTCIWINATVYLPENKIPVHPGAPLSPVPMTDWHITNRPNSPCMQLTGTYDIGGQYYQSISFLT